jgi:hypothetical protein
MAERLQCKSPCVATGWRDKYAFGVHLMSALAVNASECLCFYAISPGFYGNCDIAKHVCRRAPQGLKGSKVRAAIPITAAPAVLCDLAVLDDQGAVFRGECHVQAVVETHAKPPLAACVSTCCVDAE